MRTKIHSILNKKQFFHITNNNSDIIQYLLKRPAEIFIKNIFINWLRYINMKTQKVMPIKLQNPIIDKVEVPTGFITCNQVAYENKILQHNFHTFEKKSDVKLKLIVPKQDLIQYFIQWQRYRKYWWSSVTTTPSLFSIGDVKQHDNHSSVDIVAKFGSETLAVEQIRINNVDNECQSYSSVTCAMSLENALLVLFLDGEYNNDKDNYLRLHRKIAPYKISFAINSQDPTKEQPMKELATLMCYHLRSAHISVYLPEFTNTLEDQIQENLALGVPHTALINEGTLDNGIFHLLSSSTMIKEQVHIADFREYATLMCKEE